MQFSQLFNLLASDLRRLDPQVSDHVAGQISWIRILSPRFTPVLIIRLARFCYLSRWLRVFSPILTWLNVLLFGIEFTSKCEVGSGLMLPHTVGSVIGAIKIGSGVTIFQGVTLGAKFADLEFLPESRPTIGNGVLLGAGAKVLGGIEVGDGATVAANSLVVDNVPAGAFMLGVPAAQSLKNATL